jgi:hypothetical protein
MSEEKLLNRKSSASTANRSSTKSAGSKRKSSKKTKSLDLEHNDEHELDEHCDDEYSHFVKKNKVMWKTVTLLASLGFVGMAAGTFVINSNAEGNCLGIEGTLWLVMINHIVNACVAFLFFVGMERKLCSAFAMTVFCVLQITVLFYSQTVYFEAMNPTMNPADPTLTPASCTTQTPQRYFWLMAQILVFYISFFILICFIYRKYFQDPHLKAKELEEEAKEELKRQKLFDEQMDTHTAAAGPSINQEFVLG